MGSLTSHIAENLEEIEKSLDEKYKEYTKLCIEYNIYPYSRFGSFYEHMLDILRYRKIFLGI